MFVVFSLVCSGRASAQSRDSLVNGAVIGAAIGAGAGIAFTHAVRDSDLTASQYAHGAVVIGAIGAGIGLGIDALIHRSSSPRPAITRSRLLFAPAVGRVNGLAVQWRLGGNGDRGGNGFTGAAKVTKANGEAVRLVEP